MMDIRNISRIVANGQEIEKLVANGNQIWERWSESFPKPQPPVIPPPLVFADGGTTEFALTGVSADDKANLQALIDSLPTGDLSIQYTINLIGTGAFTGIDIGNRNLKIDYTGADVSHEATGRITGSATIVYNSTAHNYLTVLGAVKGSALAVATSKKEQDAQLILFSGINLVNSNMQLDAYLSNAIMDGNTGDASIYIGVTNSVDYTPVGLVWQNNKINCVIKGDGYGTIGNVNGEIIDVYSRPLFLVSDTYIENLFLDLTLSFDAFATVSADSVPFQKVLVGWNAKSRTHFSNLNIFYTMDTPPGFSFYYSNTNFVPSLVIDQCNYEGKMFILRDSTSRPAEVENTSVNMDMYVEYPAALDGIINFQTLVEGTTNEYVNVQMKNRVLK